MEIPSKAPRHQKLPARFISATVAFWIILWTTGFPPPNWDDLFFVGGAFELATTGHLANPLIRFWNSVASERYFFQPPFFQYALAGWIDLVGLGTRSLLGFQCLAFIVASLCGGLLLRKYDFSGAAFLPILLAFAMASQGLRHDAMGLALLALGLWLLSFPDIVRSFLGSLFLVSSIATWPVLLAYAIPLGVAVLLAPSRMEPFPASPRVQKGAAVLGGGGAAVLVFLLSIDFRLREFLQDFSWHARLRRPTLSEILPAIKHQLTNGYAAVFYGPLYTIFLLLTIAMLVRWNTVRPTARIFLCALWLGILANLLLYSSVLHVLADFFCWIGVVVLLKEIPMRSTLRRVAVAATVAAFAIAQSYVLLALAGRKSISEEHYATVRMSLPNDPSRILGIDEIAARYIFNYQLPAGAYAWNYSFPPPQTWPASTRDKARGVSWVLSPVKSSVTQGIPPAEKVRLFGREFGSIPAKPYDVVVIE